MVKKKQTTKAVSTQSRSELVQIAAHISWSSLAIVIASAIFSGEVGISVPIVIALVVLGMYLGKQSKIYK